MEDDYEHARRRLAEDRRRQREEERKKRREMLGLIRIRNVGDEVETENDADSNPILLPRKRTRVDMGRIEKLKEEKRTEEGLRLIQEMYGTSYLNADSLLDSPISHRSNHGKERCKATRLQNTASEKNHYDHRESFSSGFATRNQVEKVIRTSSTGKKCTVDDDDDDDDDFYEQHKKKKGVSDDNASSVRSKGPTDEETNEGYPCSKRQNDDIRERNKIYSSKHHEVLDSPIESPVTTSKKCKSLECEDSASEEDLLAYSRRLQKMQKKRKHSDDDEVSSIDNDDDDNQTIHEGNQKSNNSKCSSTENNFVGSENNRFQKNNVDLLWDDGDDDHYQPIKHSIKEDDEMALDDTEHRNSKSRRHTLSRHALSDVDDIEDSTDLEQKLKPEFDNPKWIGDLEPFQLTLPTENNENTKLDQVPASINRYLKDYQREGVRFLYAAVSRGLGAILGDDMGLGKTVQ
eukprot:CAMPEP_0176493172 /NCGR_PEP_ID=MMETSP0200_2-20121128/9411_1 /TAXON_ID=947934 /ORGANISM="Chaetoceros sp., Strain GSL56" /LENGTH=460 /DNA_ID=CAMNT_0017890825 /DNA_START=54 /DNA_END=1434 /DNA_ORIENTATION=-